jgi:hypothetical protein
MKREEQGIERWCRRRGWRWRGVPGEAGEDAPRHGDLHARLDQAEQRAQGASLDGGERLDVGQQYRAVVVEPEKGSAVLSKGSDRKVSDCYDDTRVVVEHVTGDCLGVFANVVPRR